ncbi:unnamed protein product [Closterium sp. Yama58-4]|nr:unnamed protein product [Closterium sp. Yama58-4]
MGAALLLPLPPACVSLSALSAPQPLLLPFCGGLLVPAGARGEVAEGGNGLSLVHFEAPLSALLILLLRLVHRAQQDQDASSAAATWQSAIGGANISASAAGLEGEEEAAEELSVGLSLLSNLLASNQACVRALLHLHSSPLVAAALANGLLPRGMTHPERVAAALSSSTFSPSALSSDLQLQSGPATSPLHLLCFQIEQPLGSFPFTLAALELAAALVQQGVTGGPVPDLLGFAVMDVMPNYGAWRMEDGRERWHMAGKVRC